MSDTEILEIGEVDYQLALHRPLLPPFSVEGRSYEYKAAAMLKDGKVVIVLTPQGESDE